MIVTGLVDWNDRRPRCFCSTNGRPTSCINPGGGRRYRRCCVTACGSWPDVDIRGCSTSCTRWRRRRIRWPLLPNRWLFHWPMFSHQLWRTNVNYPAKKHRRRAMAAARTRRRRRTLTTHPALITSKQRAIYLSSISKSNTAFSRWVY